MCTNRKYPLHFKGNTFFHNFYPKSASLCKMLTFFFKDIRLINYCWMLIEGLFFHQIVAFTFNEMSKYRKIICWSGWIVPNVVMLIYTGVRLQYGNDRCWTDLMDGKEWVLLFFPFICLGVS